MALSSRFPKIALGDVVEKIVAVGVGGDLAGAPALLQAVLRDAPVGLDGGTVIVADGNTQHGVIHLPYYYDGILYYGCPALASSHPPVCYEMLSECREMMAVLVHCQYLLFLTIYKIADTPDQFRNVARGCQIVVDALLPVLVFCCEIPAVRQDKERPGFHKSPIPFR